MHEVSASFDNCILHDEINRKASYNEDQMFVPLIYNNGNIPSESKQYYLADPFIFSNLLDDVPSGPYKVIKSYEETNSDIRFYEIVPPYHTSTHFTEDPNCVLNDTSFNVENNTLNFRTLNESTWGVGIGMINGSLATKWFLDDTHHMPHVINSGIHATDFLPNHIRRPVALLNPNTNSFIHSF